MATPLEALILVVPPRVPALGDTVIVADDVVTTLLPASSNFTTGCVASEAPAVAPTGCVVIDNWVAAPTVGVTVCVAAVSALPLTVAE